MSTTRFLASDTDCWNHFRQGNDVALGQLMTRHFAALYQYGCSFCRQTDLVDDTIQDLFYDLWLKRNTLPDVTYVKTYLFSALRNRLIDVLRQHQPITGDLSEAVEFAGAYLIESQLIDAEQQQQQSWRLQRILATLTKRQREAIYLRFYEDMDNETIAVLMGLSRPAVANLISVAIRQLRQSWSALISLLLVLLMR